MPGKAPNHTSLNRILEMSSGSGVQMPIVGHPVHYLTGVRCGGKELLLMRMPGCASDLSIMLLEGFELLHDSDVVDF